MHRRSTFRIQTQLRFPSDFTEPFTSPNAFGCMKRRTFCPLATLAIIVFSFFCGFARGQSVTNQPVFQYAIFYNNLLEFTWNAPFTNRAPVHANGDIFVGSSTNLIFSYPVEATGGIFKTNWAGHLVNTMTGLLAF